MSALEHGIVLHPLPRACASHHQNIPLWNLLGPRQYVFGVINRCSGPIRDTIQYIKEISSPTLTPLEKDGNSYEFSINHILEDSCPFVYTICL